MKRDFVSLTAQEALHVAIFIEERNAEIYHQFAEMFAEFHEPESLEIASTFWDMANEERQHGTLLQKRYFDRYGTRPCAVTEEDIRDFIEVPRLENGDIFTISKLKVGRSPRQMALEIALAADSNAGNTQSLVGWCLATASHRIARNNHETGRGGTGGP